MINVFMVNPTKATPVWLLDPVVAEGQSKKFHHPCKRPFHILKRISECNYLVESSAGKCTQTIVHFNRLKLYKPGTQYQHNGDGKLWPNADPPISQQL